MKREIVGNELHVGDRVYTAPSDVYNSDGMRIIAAMYDKSDNEFYELGLDRDGMPYERKSWTYGIKLPTDQYWKVLTLDAFIEKLEKFRQAFAGTSLDQTAPYDEAVKTASLSEVRRLTSLYGGNDPIIDRYVMYDMIESSSAPLTITIDKGGPLRLEKFVSIKRRSGKYELVMQIGWHAGTHWDGGSRCSEIPKEWLSHSWEEFVDTLCEKNRDRDLFYSKNDFMASEGLREFFGFGS